MSTRSNIAILNDDGTVRACYIHMDGYPTGVGDELLKSFNTPETISERLDKGNSSTLTERFYKDEEDDEEATVFESKDEYLTKRVNGWVEYQYLFDDGEWFVYKVPSDDGKSVLMGELDLVVAEEKMKESES